MMNQKPNPEFDEYCDPNNPKRISYDDILAAYHRIIGSVVNTPCTKAHMSAKLGMDIYYKQECMQYTGCFKERGVRNTLMLLTEEQKKYGIISTTSGNLGIAMGYHAQHFGVPCAVVVPVTASLNKVAKCEKNGVKVIRHGNNLTESKTHAMIIGKEKKLTFIDGSDHPNMIEGAGTIGIEILEQLPAADAVLVPCGAGSLLAGVAIALKQLKPDMEVYGIETDKTCTMIESLRKNERVFMEIDSTIAGGLDKNIVGANTYFNVKGLVDKMMVVKEDWVARAVLHLAEDERTVVEGGGAVGVAALMAGLFPELKDKRVVCILSGGNIDAMILARTIERGMAAEGRLVQFKVTVPDRPGAMAEMCALLGAMGITIRDCVPERAWVTGDIFSVTLKILAETKGWNHIKDLVIQIKKHYKEYHFSDVADRTDKSPSTKRGPCLAPNPICMQK